MLSLGFEHMHPEELVAEYLPMLYTKEIVPTESK
jgi:hypothetical protein